MKKTFFLLALLVILGGRGLAFGATYTVTSTANSGAGTLRQAILDANANAGADTIEIGISGSGVKTITINPAGCTGPICLDDALPAITDDVTINGFTQSGSSDAWPNPVFMTKVVTQYSATAFRVASGAVTIKGLWIVGTRHNTPGNEMTGIQIQADGTTITRNKIEGFEVDFSVRPGADNVTLTENIALNATFEGFLTQGASGTTISDNYCGVDIDGVTTSPNYYGCITVRSSTATVSGNVVAGNNADGIIVEKSPDDNSVPDMVTISSNLIGLDTAHSAQRNRVNGILLKAGTNISITGNVISSNLMYAINISPTGEDGATGVSLTGNKIGTNFSGTNSSSFCNGIVPQINGSYTDGGSNTINTDCASRKYCCKFDDDSCFDNPTLLGAFGNTVEAIGGCAELGGALGVSTVAEYANDCTVGGECNPPPTSTPTSGTTATRTPWPTNTRKVNTPRPSRTPQSTYTRTATLTPSATRTPSSTPTVTPGKTSTRTRTATRTRTETRTPQHTFTVTSTPTASVTKTPTATATRTVTKTSTRTRTPTP